MATPIYKECAYCGETYKVRPYRAASSKFHSRACADKAKAGITIKGQKQMDSCIEKIKQYFNERPDGQFTSAGVARSLGLHRLTTSDNLGRLYDLEFLDRSGSRNEGFLYSKREQFPVDAQVHDALRGTVFRNFLPYSALMKKEKHGKLQEAA